MTRNEPFDAPVRSESTFKWKALVGLIVIWVASLSGAVWVWSGLFIWWAILDVWHGETHFLERVTRTNDPLMFWIIVLSWIGLSISWLFWI